MNTLEEIIKKYGHGKRLPPLEQPRQIGIFQLGWRVEKTGFQQGYEILESINDSKQMWSYRQNEYRDWFSVIPEKQKSFRLGLIKKSVEKQKKKCRKGRKNVMQKR